MRNDNTNIEVLCEDIRDTLAEIRGESEDSTDDESGEFQDIIIEPSGHWEVNSTLCKEDKP